MHPDRVEHIEAEIVDEPLAISTTPSHVERMRQQVVANRLAYIRSHHRMANKVTEEVNVDAARRIGELSRLIGEHEEEEAAIISEDVMAALKARQIQAANAYLQRAEMADASINREFGRDLERLSRLPNSAFYTPSAMDHVRSALRGSHAQLDLRPGTRPMTPLESLKQLVWGGVAEEISRQYDRRECDDREESLRYERQLQEIDRTYAAVLQDILKQSTGGEE